MLINQTWEKFDAVFEAKSRAAAFLHDAPLGLRSDGDGRWGSAWGWADGKKLGELGGHQGRCWFWLVSQQCLGSRDRDPVVAGKPAKKKHHILCSCGQHTSSVYVWLQVLQVRNMRTEEERAMESVKGFLGFGMRLFRISHTNFGRVVEDCCSGGGELSNEQDLEGFRIEVIRLYCIYSIKQLHNLLRIWFVFEGSPTT